MTGFVYDGIIDKKVRLIVDLVLLHSGLLLIASQL